VTTRQVRTSFCPSPMVAVFWASIACAPISVDAFEEQELVPVTCADGSLKPLPGVCGCDVPDDDFDRDGAPDCIDECPDNVGRNTPVGPCGCSALTDTATCLELRGALRNLYTFDGVGTQIIDSANEMNGAVRHTVSATPLADLDRLQGNGRLEFDGLGSHVELPRGMISSLGSATFEVWLTWGGGNAWARIFDFGSNDGEGRTYLFLTPWNSFTDALRVAYSVAGYGAEITADGAAPLPVGGETGALEHVTVVIDSIAGSMRLYVGGMEASSVALASDLTAIEDVNNWLGRSNYVVDPALFGTLFEFRIYDQALSAAQINASFQAGPGALN
jgi:hypothetical protein